MNIIEKILKENILNKNTVFVFNSNIAANSWTDFIVRQDGKDSWPATIQQERFLAWDDFKGQALKAQQEGLESVPTLLRKFFARSLLERVKNGEKIFERLVNSEYKENALSFTDWLASLLPALGRWRNLADKFIKDGQLEGERNNPENRDYLKLYNEYSTFLEEKKLFEPAWQKAAFDLSLEKTFIIFFPELLDDFDEYKEALDAAQKSGKAKIVNIPELNEPIRADYWTSARLELRMAALRILQERKNGTDWNDIAIAVPDIENYRPYVERELALYQIPFVTRSGIKLGMTGAGRIFRKIQDCAAKNFSYQSVRALALDSNIPWKSPDEMEMLVRLGKESKCLVQYTDSNGKLVDPWLINLEEGVLKDSSSMEFLDAQKFYAELKKSVKKIAGSKSFKEIKEGWKKFESDFILPKEEISEISNTILSRSVSLMEDLIEIEEKFPEIAKGRTDNYSFFLNELENTQYQKQSDRRGVSVFDYKVSALANFKKQFVINASQDKVTVEKLALTFLSPSERAFLIDESEAAGSQDHSEAYIKSYAINSNCVFSASQNALDGFAIPHSALAANEDPLGPDADLDKADFIKAEKDYISQGGPAPIELTDAQKKSFESYFEKNALKEDADALKEDGSQKAWLSASIEKKTKTDRAGRDGRNDKTRLTASDLKDFFPCPRKWILKDLLRVNEFSLDTDLFETYDQGSVNHKILEMYFSGLKSKGFPLPQTSEESGKIVFQGQEDYEEKILLPLLEGFACQAFAEAKSYKKSALVQEALKSQNKIFAQGVLKFLREFCKKENYSGWTVEETEWGQEKDKELPPILQGRMDLVLRSPDNKIAIIDYKNTESSIPKGDLFVNPKDSGDDIKELDDCQIAAYVFLWEGNKQEPEDKVQNAEFVSIKNFKRRAAIKENPGPREKAVDRPSFEPSIQSLKRRAAFMQKCLEENKFSLSEVKRYKHCITCDYKSFCRTTY